MLAKYISKKELFADPVTVMTRDGVPSPIVLSSPHAGRHYPIEMTKASALDRHLLRTSEDAFVTELFGHVDIAGLRMVSANFPRVYVDVNRDRREIDRSLLRDPEQLVLTETLHTNRVKNGLGVVAKVVSHGVPIYDQPLETSEIFERLKQVYDPYHQAIQAAISRALEHNEYCLLIDCHSMPGGQSKLERRSRPDIVLGDRHGRSCAPALSATLERYFSDYGYTVARNRPYAGGFITSHYSAPELGIHTLQIELSRPVYMDEHQIKAHDGFFVLQKHLRQVLAALADIPSTFFAPTAQLAEGAE